ncbi:hypothetical protein KGQ24_03020 [Patescibacteria group bacterium]|nr:hypothetical protein [Patescibacteria group bacterium]
MKKYFSGMTVALLLVLNLFAFSPAIAADCGTSGRLTPDLNTGLCVPSSTLTGPNTVNDLIIKIINVLLSVAAIIAVLFIIIGGFRYITSAGNEEQAEKGRGTLVNAIIGLVIIILAYVIVGIVNNTFAQRGLFGIGGL